ncbi:MAG: hypothetical protein KGN79_09435 [Acidobacteriota bacterium]|nr:hypothetical protein [Acidobacteriota bacterium]
MAIMRHRLTTMLLCFLAIFPASALSQAFDLVGPEVNVHVKRGDVTLPISEVPNLLPGDRLWVHPDMPASQSEHFVLVIAFLRGATNPPPEDWFTRVEVWQKKIREEGVFVTVPDEAQQALVFLAPATGGDFSTLRNTVRGRPGTFVRAAQDLQAASWDRMRLDAFLKEVKVTSLTDPKSLKERTENAARSLGIKVNQDCFLKPSEQQSACLSQHTEGMVMDDSNAQTRVDQLATGSTTDLMNQLSYSHVGGGGQYSPYIGAIVDTAKILASLHTARYQYIPALALSSKDTLNLRLNLPPSFRDPKSVVVIALPPIGPVTMPPLHPVSPTESFCAQKPKLVLPAEGAPLVLATPLAHDLMLRIESKNGPIELPVHPDPAEGGLELDKPAPLLDAGDHVGVVHGKWGFDDWEGPRYRLRSSGQSNWEVTAADQSALVVGREDKLQLEGQSTLCIEDVKARTASGDALPLTWKAAKPEVLDLSVSMKSATPGQVTLEVHQFGLDKPDSITLRAYAEAASLEKLLLSQGDATAVLSGNRLDEVETATLHGITWSPSTLSRVQDSDRLTMKADGPTDELNPGNEYRAKVRLRDGRELEVPMQVTPPRPVVTLLSKGTQEETKEDPSPVHLGSPDDLPIDRRLVFFLRSKVPVNFPRKQRVEVSSADGSFHTILSLSDGSLMLEDAKTALGVVEPLARFGSSAFGPIQARAISPEGVTGDWIPLGTLVRLPGFKTLNCPRAQSKPCVLTGSNLFLATSFAAAPEFDNPTDVPPDFTGTQLIVPHPANGVLYVRLRDDQSVVQTLAMQIDPLAPGMTPPSSPTPAPGTDSSDDSTSGPAEKSSVTPAAPEDAAPSDGEGTASKIQKVVPAKSDTAPAAAKATPKQDPQ